MGGKNHQPCRGYLEESVKMSRAASFAYAHLELANVALEDALTAEFEGGGVSLGAFTKELQTSLAGLEELGIQIIFLHKVMNDRSFQDLPTVKSLDWTSIGKAMVSDGLVSPEGWQKICQIMETSGFFGVIDHFLKMRSNLVDKTKDLLCQVEILEKSGSIINTLEENHQGNIKPAFARLYTAWVNFQQEFLASSMFSTEACMVRFQQI